MEDVLADGPLGDAKVLRERGNGDRDLGLTEGGSSRPCPEA